MRESKRLPLMRTHTWGHAGIRAETHAETQAWAHANLCRQTRAQWTCVNGWGIICVCHLSTYLCMQISTCPPAYCLFILCVHVRLCIYHLSVHFSCHLPVYLHLCIACLFIQHLYHPSIHLPVYLCIHPSSHPSCSLSSQPAINASVCTYLSSMDLRLHLKTYLPTISSIVSMCLLSSMYLHQSIYSLVTHCIWSLSAKSPAIVNIMRMVCMTWM